MSTTVEPTSTGPQTEVRRRRRTYSAKYKLSILAEIDAATENHYHSGIGNLRPTDVHDGKGELVRSRRQATLDAAHAAHPERFTKRPTPPHPATGLGS